MQLGPAHGHFSFPSPSMAAQFPFPAQTHAGPAHPSARALFSLSRELFPHPAVSAQQQPCTGPPRGSLPLSPSTRDHAPLPHPTRTRAPQPSERAPARSPDRHVSLTAMARKSVVSPSSARRPRACSSVLLPPRTPAVPWTARLRRTHWPVSRARPPSRSSTPEP